MKNRNEVIQAALVKYPKAKKIAVENVSGWYRGTWEDTVNLHSDAQSYGWNADTMKAILYIHGKAGNA